MTPVNAPCPWPAWEKEPGLGGAGFASECGELVQRGVAHLKGIKAPELGWGLEVQNGARQVKANSKINRIIYIIYIYIYIYYNIF